MQSFTFSAASSSLANFQKINAIPNNRRGAPQFGRVFCRSNTATGSATLTLVLVKNNTVVWAQTAAVAPGARRTAADNASGNYICSTAFTLLGSDQFDLLGCETAANLAARNEGTTYEWYIGCTALTTITSLEVDVAVSFDKCT